MKEGETLLFEEEKELDEIDEAEFTADEASLYHLGGFALFALLKTNSISEKVLSILKNLCLPLNEKVDLPSNIQHLDKGSLTFMKKELLGYIGMVRVIGVIMYWTQCGMGLFIESVRGAAYKPGWHFTAPLGYVVYLQIDLWYLWSATCMLQLAEDSLNSAAICSKWNNIVARMKGEEFLSNLGLVPINPYQKAFLVWQVTKTLLKDLTRSCRIHVSTIHRPGI